MGFEASYEGLLARSENGSSSGAMDVIGRIRKSTVYIKGRVDQMKEKKMCKEGGRGKREGEVE